MSAREWDVVALLQELVRIPSVNPTATNDPAIAGEQRCAEAVSAHLRALGAAEVTLPEVLPGRPNVLARFPSDRPDKPRLLLAPHLDTVGVEGMTIDPFAAEERAGRIWGRGTTDTKGTMAAMLCALHELHEVLPLLSHEVWFAGLMGEEAGNEGAQWLVDSGYRADFALIGEPTECQAMHAHKGALWLRLRTPGVAAHAASPERGVNAIYAMSDVIRAVRDVLGPALAAEADAVLGAASVNIGIVRGGRKINVVPDECEAELDVRTLPGQQDDAFILRIAAILRSMCHSLEVELIRRHPPLLTDPAHPLVRRLESQGATLTTAPWFCDGSLLAQAGIPSVAAGPGSIVQAHTADEFIEIAALRRGVEFYRGFLASLKV